MHANHRYVKLAWIAAVAALALPVGARAEIVAPTQADARLAVARDGSPRVAFLSQRDVVIGGRGADHWVFTRVGRAPNAKGFVAGLVVDRRGRTSVLVEAENGAWLALAASGGKLRVVARPRRGASFGPAGLTLDAADRPAFAYVLRLPSAKSWLRLVTRNARGKLQSHGITTGGFPTSDLSPGAAPVLVGRSLHVVETYTSAAIDWGPKPGGGWVGQFIFGSVRGSPQGQVGAVFQAGTLWAAWTQVTPELGSIDVVLASSAETQESWFLSHGILVAIARGPNEPLIGAYDWVDLGDDWREYAGLVILGPGSAAWQLDGRLDALAVGPDSAQQLLLTTESGLEWFRAPAPTLPGIEVRMAIGADGHVTGSVIGATNGVVAIYREVPHAPRQLISTAEVQPDSSYTADVPPPATGTLYRAVYRDPQTGIPFAFLPGVAVGASD
jgi:hypothetical protein